MPSNEPAPCGDHVDCLACINNEDCTFMEKEREEAWREDQEDKVDRLPDGSLDVQAHKQRMRMLKQEGR